MSIGTWKTLDGTVIKITDMTNSHITNCINLLEKRAPAVVSDMIDAGTRYCPHGEMAEMAIEQELDALFAWDGDPGDIFPVYNELVDELYSRTTNGIVKELQLEVSAAFKGKGNER